MTQSGRLHFHQHLTLTGWVEFDLLDMERAAFRIRRWQLHFVQDGGSRFHALSSWWYRVLLPAYYNVTE
jgi:hypothetical protein